MNPTPTKPLTDPSMWRRLLARAHPDTGGSDELCVWAQALRNYVLTGKEPPRRESRSSPQTSGREERTRVAYSPPEGYEAFDSHTAYIEEAVAPGEPEPIARLLWMLEDCPGAGNSQDTSGATFKQLHFIAGLAGLDDAHRRKLFAVAEEASLRSSHAGHIIKTLKGGKT